MSTATRLDCRCDACQYRQSGKPRTQYGMTVRPTVLTERSTT